MNLLNKIRNNSLLKTGVNYSIASSAKSFAMMLVGILIMRWLEPKELGMWNAISIFQAYVPFFQLGIQSGLNRDLPILLGKNEEDRAYFLVANAKYISYIISLFFILLGFVISIVLLFLEKELSLIAGILTISIMAASSSIQLHLIATFRSAKAFDKLTRIFIVDTLLILGLTIFIYLFHYYGILIYNVIQYIVSSVLFMYYAPYKHIKPVLCKKTFFYLTTQGIALMSFNQIRSFAQSIPRWMILFFAGVSKLGLFSPAMAINSLMNMFPVQIAQFLHPQLGYKYGQTGNAKDLWPYVKKIVILFPLIALPMCIGIWFFAPWLLDNFFPKYRESMWAMRIMAVGFVFSGAFTTHGILYTLKAYKPAYFFSAVELIGYFLWPYLVLLIFKIDILESVCIGLAFNHILLYFLNILLLKKFLFKKEYNKV